MELKTDISRKGEIKNELIAATNEIANICNEVNDAKFYENIISDKWSIAENLDHLSISSKATVKALGLSKPMLESFGSLQRPCMTSDELLSTYKSILAKSAVAPSKFFSAKESLGSKAEMLTAWQSIMDRLVARMEYWSEEDLDKYCIYHPAIGNITIRELLFFTVFHTRHHYNAIERLVLMNG